MKIPVLCCCNPQNQIGVAPQGLAFEVREFVDLKTGETGIAYPSGDHDKKINWSKISGFEPTAKKGGTKTWKDKPNPKKWK